MLTRRSTLALMMAAPVALALSPRAFAQTDEIYNDQGVAVDGTDMVAYFTESRPVAGDASITHNWKGVTWQFASTENRDLFAANPQAYAPQYGGYCAFAVSEGYIAPTVPQAWTIYEGKLYLNFSCRIRRRWERDIPGPYW